VINKATPGRVSLFRHKVRGKPLSVLLTPRHRALLEDAAQRLQLSLGDVVALLIHKYSRTVQIPASKNLVADDTE
jgi:hypothetical protein